jgi:bifunctional non-homologous end joining protein LigD
MLPRRTLHLPDDGRHLFDPSWGGLRVLAYVGPAGARLIAARGRDLTSRVPEVSAGLSEALAGRGPCIVDGELVAPDAAGRLDRGALAARLGRSRAAERRAVRAGPASLIAWDVLVAGGRPLLARPLSERRERLLKLLRPAAHVVPLTPFVGGGAELLAAAQTMGLAAVVAKHAAGPYLPGVRSRLWLRVDLPVDDRGGAEQVGPASRPDLVALLRLPWD